jgi:hypothetical protein
VEQLHKLTDKSNDGCLTLRNKDNTIDVLVKFDGCINFTRYENGYNAESPEGLGDEDYIHICDVDEMIKLLEEIKQKASNYFNNEYWKEKK